MLERKNVTINILASIQFKISNQTNLSLSLLIFEEKLKLAMIEITLNKIPWS